MKDIILGRFHFDKKDEKVIIVRQKANTSSVLATRHSNAPFYVKASDLREASAEECKQYRLETKKAKRKKRGSLV